MNRDKEFFKKGHQGSHLPLPKKEMQELFLIALVHSKGNMSEAARQINVHFTTVYRWKKESEELAAAIQEIKTHTTEKRLDQAENTIDFLVESGDGPTARWFLDRQGQNRGYGKPGRQETQGTQIAIPVYGDLNVHGYPPVPETVAEWEAQIEESKATKETKARESQMESQKQKTLPADNKHVDKD